MTIVILKDWKEGLQKVSLSLIQTEVLSMSLKEVKKNVDDLLAGKEVEVHVQSEELAGIFMERIQAIGVICERK